MSRNKQIVNETVAAMVVGFAFLIMASASRTFAQISNPFASSAIAKADAKPDASPSNAESGPEVPAPTPKPTWTGFYVGGYVGGTSVKATASTSTTFTTGGYFAVDSPAAISTVGTQQLSRSGFSGGGQVGYNHQSGRFVIGAEADFGVTGGGTITATGSGIYPCCTTTGFTITQSLKSKWLMTARPRAGYIWHGILIYGTGGLAVTDLNYQAVFTDTFAAAAENGGVNKIRIGWTGGGGAGYKLGKKWSVKAEYLFADFGRVTTTSANMTVLTPPINALPTIFTHSIYTKESAIRFGVNYHF
ncbi:MAG: outer membrane protein [Pyrinomonadaceae bacterium]